MNGSQSQTEANVLIATAIFGPQKLSGIFWDDLKNRTRMVLGTDIHKARLRLFKGKEEDLYAGFVFDVFQREEDLRRAEEFVGISPPDNAARIAAVLTRLSPESSAPAGEKGEGK
jgi:hypothetical protein